MRMNACTILAVLMLAVGTFQAPMIVCVSLASFQLSRANVKVHAFDVNQFEFVTNCSSQNHQLHGATANLLISLPFK